MKRLTKTIKSNTLIRDGWMRGETDSYTGLCYGCSEINRCKQPCGFDKALKKLAKYEDIGLDPKEILEIKNKLIDLLTDLEGKDDGDGAENYTNGYRWGHRNGQRELIEWILKINKGEKTNENS